MELLVVMVVAGVLGAATAALMAAGDDSRDGHAEEPGLSGNPHSKWLGKEVVVRHHATNEEERCVVICESWKGAVRVRPIDGDKAYWVSKQFVDERVREP